LTSDEKARVFEEKIYLQRTVFPLLCASTLEQCKEILYLILLQGEYQPESVSFHRCASFVVCDLPIKVHFVGVLQAMKVAC